MSDGAPVSQEIKLPTDVSGLNAATRKLDEMIARVDKLERAAERHHKKSEAEWGGVESSVKKAKNAVQEFMGFVGATLAFEALEKIADKFIEIGKEALNAAAKAERMNFAIDAAAGSKEAGTATRKWLEENSKHSEFTEAQNESAYLFLKRYGVGQQKAGLFMKGAEDLAAVAGPDERQQVYQEALSALARVHARGRIDTRSAMRLGIGVEDFASLPQFAGMSKKSISKAVQSGAGNVTENDLLNLIMHRTGEKAIGEKSADASQLLLTRMSKLAELPERFFKRLGETSAAKKLSDEIGAMVEKLDPDSPTGKRIYGALESTFSSIADKVGEIDFDALADTITEDVLPAIKAMSTMILDLIEPIERVIRGLHRIKNIFSDSSGFEEGPAVAARRAQRRETNAVAAAFPDKSVDLGHGTTATHGAFHLVGQESGEAMGEGFSDGVETSTAGARASTKRLGKKSHEALKEATDSHSPSKKAEEVGTYFGDGFALGVEGSSSRIADAIDSTFRMPAGMFSGAASGVGMGGGISVSFDEGAIQITIQGGDKDTGAAVRDELARSLRPLFIDILEGARGGGGAG